MREVKAVKDKLAVAILKVEAKSKEGIILPDTYIKEPQLTCQVISVGSEVTSEVKVGDLIYCHHNAGMDILIDEKPWKILTDGEVYAVLKSVEKEEE
ncbi:hypothetical protein KAR91_74080 [Candidatus Pacearchaeota archaeon]|nr:hypothetical protein [Candidatus Pacearchaeota archaeon]